MYYGQLGLDGTRLLYVLNTMFVIHYRVSILIYCTRDAIKHIPHTSIEFSTTKGSGEQRSEVLKYQCFHYFVDALELRLFVAKIILSILDNLHLLLGQ